MSENAPPGTTDHQIGALRLILYPVAVVIALTCRGFAQAEPGKLDGPKTNLAAPCVPCKAGGIPEAFYSDPRIDDEGETTDTLDVGEWDPFGLDICGSLGKDALTVKFPPMDSGSRGSGVDTATITIIATGGYDNDRDFCVKPDGSSSELAVDYYFDWEATQGVMLSPDQSGLNHDTAKLSVVLSTQSMHGEGSITVRVRDMNIHCWPRESSDFGSLDVPAPDLGSQGYSYTIPIVWYRPRGIPPLHPPLAWKREPTSRQAIDFKYAKHGSDPLQPECSYRLRGAVSAITARFKLVPYLLTEGDEEGWLPCGKGGDTKLTENRPFGLATTDERGVDLFGEVAKSAGLSAAGYPRKSRYSTATKLVAVPGLSQRMVGYDQWVKADMTFEGTLETLAGPELTVTEFFETLVPGIAREVGGKTVISAKWPTRVVYSEPEMRSCGQPVCTVTFKNPRSVELDLGSFD